MFRGDLGVFGIKIKAWGNSHGGNCRKNCVSAQSAKRHGHA